MERRLSFEVNPDASATNGKRPKTVGRPDLLRPRDGGLRVKYSRRDLHSIAGLTNAMNVDGHRADLVILRGAQAHAACHGRTANHG
jgi:Mg-chelatase subunit ChlI